MIPSEFYTYLAIYFSTIIIGNAAAFSTFILAFLGRFGHWGFLYVIITVLLADISADCLWYFSGRWLHNTKFGNFIKNHLPHHDLIYKHVHEGNLKWLYLAKFVSSTSAPFLFLIGWSQSLNFKKFFHLSIRTIIVWLGLMIISTTALSLGLLPFQSIKFFKNLEVTITAIAILFIGFEFLLKFLSKKPAIRNFLKKLGGLNNGNSNHSDLIK
ncbi:MAG: hypothetical protein AAB738_03845 [Patescibacteria group bacterium]